MAALLIVLAHAVDRHVDPAIVLNAANVDGQTGVLLTDRRVHAGGFFEHVGGVAWRVAVQLFAADHVDRTRRLVDPVPRVRGVDLGGRQAQHIAFVHRQLEQLHGRAFAALGLVVFEADTAAVEQLAQGRGDAVVALHGVARAALQLCVADQQIDPGLSGQGVDGGVQWLSRHVERTNAVERGHLARRPCCRALLSGHLACRYRAKQHDGHAYSPSQTTGDRSFYVHP